MTPEDSGARGLIGARVRVRMEQERLRKEQGKLEGIKKQKKGEKEGGIVKAMPKEKEIQRMTSSRSAAEER